MGWEATLILGVATELMTDCERMLTQGLLDAAWTLGKKNAPASSRRKYEGWYPTIGEDRRALRAHARVLALLQAGERGKSRRAVRRLSATAKWLGPDFPEGDTGEEDWEGIREGLMDTVAGMKRKLHGSGRKQTRIRVLEHVAKREKNGAENNWRPVVASVLGTTKGSSRLETVTTAEGEVLTAPEEVKAATRDFFTDMFAGAGTAPWYQTEEGGEHVAHT